MGYSPWGCRVGPGHLVEGNPVSEGTTRRGTDTPVRHPEKPAFTISYMAGGRCRNSSDFTYPITLDWSNDQPSNLLVRNYKTEFGAVPCFGG